MPDNSRNKTQAAGLLLLFAAGLAQGAPRNTITIVERSGAAQRSRPFTISRVFVRGEIPHYAAARVGSRVLPTQCDVKTRWLNGSLQHAMVSFLLDLEPHQSLTVEFVDQSESSDTGFLTKTEILNPEATWAANLGAQIVATQGSTQVADLRTMLTEWDEAGATGSGARYWLRGPIASQLIVEDKDPASLRYDFGWDGGSASATTATRSLHPIFVVTLYRGSPSLRIEMILENMWTTKLKDQHYSLELRVGNPPPAAPAYVKEAFDHYALTRWRKVFWSGPAPGAVRVDHNLPYLIRTGAVPSYDLRRTVGPADVARELAAFRAGDQGDINGAAQWTPYFPTGGGRGDIGLFPRWYVRYLYTFAPELEDVLLGNAAASGHIPIHYRESLTGRSYNEAGSGEAFGRSLSIDARPTVRTASTPQDTRPEDRITPLGPVSTGRWTVDLAHQPSLVFLPYLLTGDWYFLEELYFWAAYNLARGNPGSTLSYNRHASWGFLNDDQEIRGVAWGLRNLGHAAWAAPDGTPEKEYFTRKLELNIAVREGKHHILDGAFLSSCRTEPYDPQRETSPWCWGWKTVAGGKSNPLQFLEAGSEALITGLDATKVFSGSSPWMLNFNHVVLGHLQDLGFPVGKLRETAARNLLHQIMDPAYNPYLVASYRIPVSRRPSRDFIDNWAEIKAGHLQSEVTAFAPADLQDAEHGYPHIARAAASFLVGVDDGAMRGQDAWEWVNAHVATSWLDGNPKWALIPRLVTAELPPYRPAEPAELGR